MSASAASRVPGRRYGTQAYGSGRSVVRSHMTDLGRVYSRTASNPYSIP